MCRNFGLCLTPHAAKNILKIRLGEVLRPDTKIWFGERLGLFNVKSAYRLIKVGSLNCLGDT